MPKGAKKNGNLKNKIDPGIIVALISLFGTVIVALLASPVLITLLERDLPATNIPPETAPPYILLSTDAPIEKSILPSATPIPTLALPSSTETEAAIFISLSTSTPAIIPTNTNTPITPTLTNQFDVNVPANIYWYDTSITVRQGQQLDFTAKGTWWNGISPTGPDGDINWPCDEKYIVPCGNLGSLVGKIDNGDPFKIGSSFTLFATLDGNLYLSMNDNTGACESDQQGSCFYRNLGELQVTITVR